MILLGLTKKSVKVTTDFLVSLKKVVKLSFLFFGGADIKCIKLLDLGIYRFE